MKTIIQNFKNALYGKNYIGDFGTKSFWGGTGYLSLFIFLSSLALFLPFVFFVAPYVTNFFDEQKVEQFVQANVPADFELEVRDGIVYTKDNATLAIPLSDKMRDEFESGDDIDYENAFVVDTEVTDSIEAKEAYKTIALLTRDKLLVSEEEGVKVIDIDKDIEDFTVTQENILSKYSEIKPIIKTILVIAAPVLFLFFVLLNIVGYWILSLICGGILVLILEIKKIKIAYSKAIIISLYVLSVPVLLSALFHAFGSRGLGFLGTILVFVLLLLINMSTKKEIE